VSDLVTGEAVVLELRLAKLASRFLALAIDLALQCAVLVGALLLVGGLADTADGALLAAVSLSVVVGVLLVYPVTVETLSRGRSLGKLALGLRVVRDDGGPVRFRHAFLRALLGVVEIWATFGAVALIASLASTKGKRLGDVLAGTVVIRERMPSQGGPVAQMPPGLEGWAYGLDLSRLPDDLALAARQYVARAGDLAPEVRDAMGARLAAAVDAVVSPPPPHGVPPWSYLSAVLAERRRRELARLAPTGAAQPGWGPPRPPQPWGQPPEWGQSAPAHHPAQQPAGSRAHQQEPPAHDPTNPFAPPG
jgi:uncharacterized RDD family membrane protein YckC